MATQRQLQLEQAFRLALKELGSGVSTEFLIAVTSERTKADPDEIIEASIDEWSARARMRARARSVSLRNTELATG
jgi:hypothetical protein